MAAILARLYETIRARAGADPATSYTASLLAAGCEGIAGKVREEADETAVAGVSESRERLVAESADLVYHLLVLWAARDVTPDQVWAELERREGVSGLAEKVRRGKKGREGGETHGL